MPIPALLARNRRRNAALAAYAQIVARARDPHFYRDWGVPDTLDGRYELLALHAFLALNRLKREHALTQRFAQDLFDAMFDDLDRAVREMGASDIGVGRHVKAMARGFYGRVGAYEAGLAGGETALGEALARNLFGTLPPGTADLGPAVRYVERQMAALAEVPVARLIGGDIPFAPIAEAAA